jgi:hypothetical protein
LLEPIGIRFPNAIANTLGSNGGVLDLVAVIVIAAVALLLSHGVSGAARVENVLVVLKVLAILTFIVVGLTAIHVENYVPFIPKYRVNSDGTAFGGWQGIYAGVSMIFYHILVLIRLRLIPLKLKIQGRQCLVEFWVHC